MKRTRTTIVSVAVVFLSVFMVNMTKADWNPGDPYKMHYPQLPDLTTTGMDVLANYPEPFFSAAPVGKVLADDWMCTASGPVTDIHIWGSWWEDILPQRRQGDLLIPDPGYVLFRLSIHEDIPAVIDPSGRVLEHSRPGNKLWERFYEPGDPRWTWRLYQDDIFEQFYDPNINQIIGIDTAAYQYNFFVDPADAFQQEEGKIYWLDVIAIQIDPQPGTAVAVWGWKTSLQHFNDDAVFGDVIGLDTNPSADPQEWFELRYPANHPFQGQSIDLAFVITPEPVTLAVLVLGALAALIRRRV